jgi:hydroxyacylglutathione hydrolase
MRGVAPQGGDAPVLDGRDDRAGVGAVTVADRAPLDRHGSTISCVAMSRISVQAVRALKDNYVYLVIDADDHGCAIVDPGEAAPVEAAVRELELVPRAIWATHHHADHTGGIEELVGLFPGIQVIGSAYDGERGRIPQQTWRVADGETFEWADVLVRAMHVPAHTLGHTVFLAGNDLFSGDTLFGAGCGRLFEGDPTMMVSALRRLRALPDDTRIWCGHEYTRHNLKFAVEIEPRNEKTRARLATAKPGFQTVPLSIGEEKATNPFMRWDAPEVKSWAKAEGDVPVFATVRKAKDGWKEPPG